MLSIHSLQNLIATVLKNIIIISNIIPIVANFFFFIIFIYIILTTTFFFKKFDKFLKNTISTFFWMFNIFLLFFIVLKFFFNNYVNKLNYLHKLTLFKVDTTWFFVNFFGETLTLLCILTTIISWFYLSERYSFTQNTNNFYFLIFTVLTINMVNTLDILLMFLFFEFTFLPSLFFVYSLGYSKKVDKTIKYLLIWTLAGSFLVLCTISYIFSITKSTSLIFLKSYNFSFLEKNIIYFLLLIGFGIKIPLWPFHYWLTKVHVEAPTGFSIFLSGFLVKTAVYCFFLVNNIFKGEFSIYLTLTWVLWGSFESSIRMWSVTDIKKLIAFATIQEMNLILVLYIVLSNNNYTFVNLFLLMHGVLSALMFFLVDQIQKKFQTRNINSLSGLSTFCPNLVIIIWLMILTFRGFPLFCKFLIEWELLLNLVLNYSIFGVFIFFTINIFGILGFTRIWLVVLYGQPSKLLIKSSDILKNDLIFGIFLIFILFLLSFLIFIF